jgi:hypothetical protein
VTAAPTRRIIPDIEAFEERVAIAEYDGGLPRPQAENLAAQEQGFATADAYWQWLADYVVNRGIR